MCPQSAPLMILVHLRQAETPLQDQMPAFITQVCQAVLKRTFKLLKRSTTVYSDIYIYIYI